MKVHKRMNSQKPKSWMDVAPSSKPNPSQPLPPERYLTTMQAAAFLNFSPETVKKWRQRKIGPAYVKGETGAVRYRLSVLLQYLDECARAA